MFTGIISQIAQIEHLERQENKDLLLILKIKNSKNLNRKFDLGCSIACNGICLTLIKLEEKDDYFLCSFQASDETIQKTNLKNWQIGKNINIEFALKVGDELGGHLVSGHVDDISEIKSIEKIDESHRFTFSISENLAKFICKKGSVVLDGISLTVNEVNDDSFEVNIIDHTLKNTNLGFLKAGDKVNLEIDQISRYLDRLNQFRN